MCMKKSLKNIIISVVSFFWVILISTLYLKEHTQYLTLLDSLLNLYYDYVLFAIILLLALGIGIVIFNKFRIQFPSKLETFILSSALGFWVLILLYILIGFSGVLYRGVIIGVLIVLVLVVIRPLLNFFRNISQEIKSDILQIKWNKLLIIFFLITVTQIVLNSISSITPPYEWDTLSYTLESQLKFVQAHKIIQLPYMHQQFARPTIEFLYGYGIIFDADIFPKMLHCYFGILTLLVIYAFCRRHFTREIGIIALGLFYTCPIIVWFSGVGKADLGIVFFSAIAFYTFFSYLLNEVELREKGFWLSAFFTGAVGGSSFLGLLSMCSLFITYILYNIIERKDVSIAVLKKVTIFIIVALIIASPLYIKNAVLSGNPVYPFFNRIFRSDRGSYFENLIVMLSKDKTISTISNQKNFLEYFRYVLWDFTIYGRNYDLSRFNSQVTPFYLLLLPLLFFIKKTKTLKYIIISFLLYFVFSQLSRANHTRYLASIFPLLSIASAFVIMKCCTISNIHPYIKRIITFISLFLVILLLIYNTIIFVANKPLFFTFGFESRNTFLSRMTEIYPASKFINENLPPSTKLLFFSDERGYYINYPFLPITAGRFAKLMLLLDGNIEEFHKILKKLKVTHILYNQGFYKLFQKVQPTTEIVEKYFPLYAKSHLKLIYSEYGIKIFEVVDAVSNTINESSKNQK